LSLLKDSITRLRKLLPPNLKSEQVRESCNIIENDILRIEKKGVLQLSSLQTLTNIFKNYSPADNEKLLTWLFGRIENDDPCDFFELICSSNSKPFFDWAMWLFSKKFPSDKKKIIEEGILWSSAWEYQNELLGFFLSAQQEANSQENIEAKAENFEKFYAKDRQLLYKHAKMTALHMAALYNNCIGTKTLLEKNKHLKINAQIEPRHTTDKISKKIREVMGYSALMIAVKNNCTELVIHLLNYSQTKESLLLDIIGEDKKTALALAALNDNFIIFNKLLEC
jgi:hypothetical protein